MRRRDFPKALALTAAAGSLVVAGQAGAQTTSYPRGHFFRYLTAAQRTAFENNNTAVALSAELQAWINDCYAEPRVAGYMPKGTALTTQTLQIPGAVVLRGDGAESVIKSAGCDCMQINGHRVTIESLTFQGSGRMHSGIVVKGTSGPDNALSVFTGRDLTLGGFLYAINGEYMQLSVLDNIEVGNSHYGVRLFGECVNVSISNSRINLASHKEGNVEYPWGAACIVASNDTVAGTHGEGLLVTNCLLTSADSAFKANGWFLAAGFYNCICDLLKGVAFDLKDVRSFTFNGPWVYSQNACFSWPNPGAETIIGASITVGRAETLGPDNVIYWGANNKGLSVLGGQLVLMNSPGYPLMIHGSQASVVGVNIIRPAVGMPGAWVTGTDVHLIGVTGNNTQD